MHCECLRQIRKIGLIALSLPRLGAHVHKSTLRSKRWRYAFGSPSSLQTLRYTPLALSPILLVRNAG